MLQAEQLPASISDLDTGLTDVDRDGCEDKGGGKNERRYINVIFSLEYFIRGDESGENRMKHEKNKMLVRT